MKRRDLFKGTLAAAAFAGGVARADDDFPGICDTNVNLFPWPFRRLPLDETERLVAKLRSLGITRAFAGSFEGLFHRDLGAANDRLIEECARFPELVPAVSINPSRAGWQRDLNAVKSVVRLHPGYHGYGLDHPGFADLLATAADRGWLVQLCVAIEDARTQPELMRVPEVDLAPLPAAMARAPEVKVQLLNWKARGTLTNALQAIPRLSFDTALVDGTDGVATVIDTFGPDRVLYGSHAPFLIPEAALVRVHEAALDAVPLTALLRGNADRWLA